MLLALVVLGTGTTLAVPSLRWRAHVVLLHMTGELPGIELDELLALIRPGSPYDNMARLIETRNPFAVVRNPYTGGADTRAGGELFQNRCAACHSPDASGSPRGPALVGRELEHGASDWAIYRTIRDGVPGTAMVAQQLPMPQVWQLIAFVRSVDAPASASIAGGNGAAQGASVNVAYESLRSTAEPGDDWLTYSGSYSSTRHSALSQIDRSNVARLALRWIHQLPADSVKVETSPLVRGGIMFATLPPGRVLALDAATGRQHWAFDHAIVRESARSEFGRAANRGVAMLDDKVFVATQDAYLVALSAATGEVVWKTRIADHDLYYVSGAPLAYRDLIVTGVGTLGGGRGFLAAYDAATGKERWRFIVIPGPGEPGNDTWAGDSWRDGGASTWLTGSYDAEEDLIIWGVGNPKPDYDAGARRGDNLHSNSAIALRGATGELVWHFQFTPAGDKDWDSAQIPVFAEQATPAGPKKRVLWANRNGFYYVLDRLTGQFITAQPFVQQTWAERIDERGRPVLRSQSDGAQKGFLNYPGNVGGTNWWSPTFDPELQLLFVPALEQGMVFFDTTKSWPTASRRPFYTAVRALDAFTGRRVWEYAHTPRLVDNEMGGLLSTRGGIVFGGDQHTFFALDARTGQRLWSVELGGLITSSPIAFAVGGEQHVAVAAGRDLLTFALPRAIEAAPAIVSTARK